MLYERSKDPQDLVKSLSFLEKCLAIEPNFADLDVRAGYLYFKAGRFEEAEQLLKNALALEPDEDTFDTWLLLAQIYKERGAYDQALIALKKAQVAQPDPFLRKILKQINDKGSVKDINLPIYYPPIDII
jgi:tetratricopeptide (TPR) repeat protein